jgi:hypothetical protein
MEVNSTLSFKKKSSAFELGGNMLVSSFVDLTIKSFREELAPPLRPLVH